MGRTTPVFVFLGTAILFWAAAAAINNSLITGSPDAGHAVNTAEAPLPAQLQNLQREVQSDPQNTDKQLALAEALSNEAFQRSDSNLLMQSVQSYTAVLQAQPENPRALIGLANLSFETGVLDKALDYYERYIKLMPGDLRARTNRALALLQANQNDQALAALKEILKEDPKFFPARLSLALAHKIMGNIEEARKEAQLGREAAPDKGAERVVDQFIADLDRPEPQMNQQQMPQQDAGMPPVQPGQPNPHEAAQTGEAKQPAPAVMPGAAPVPDTPVNSKEDLVAYFQKHPVLGPKLVRVEWADERTVNVLLNNFQVSQMPDFAKQIFQAKMQAKLQAFKEETTVRLVDAASGQELMSVKGGPAK